MTAALILAMGCLGGLLAFARDGTFPGQVPGLLSPWLLRTGEPRWTLRRWFSLFVIGIAPACLVWSTGLAGHASVVLIDALPGGWPRLLRWIGAHEAVVPGALSGFIWFGMALAWSTGHAAGQDIGHMHGTKIGDAALLGLSGALMGLPVAGVLAVGAHWQCALVALLAGAAKGVTYWLGWQIKPRPGGDPLWATQIGAIGHGVVLFAGLAAAILLR